MSNFQVASFYGLSAPMAVLSTKSDLTTMFEYITTGIGLDMLTNLKFELYFLKEVIESDSVQSTDNFDAYMMMIGSQMGFKNVRQLKMYIANMRLVAQGSEPMMSTFMPMHTVEEWKEVEKQLKSVPKTLSGAVTHERTKGTKDTVRLSEEANNLLTEIYTQATKQDKKGVTKLDWILAEIQKTIGSQQSMSMEFMEKKISHLMTYDRVIQFNHNINESYNLIFSELKEKAFRIRSEEVRNEIETVLDKGFNRDSKETNKTNKAISLDLAFLERIKHRTDISTEQAMKLQTIWNIVKVVDEEYLKAICKTDDVDKVDSAIQELEDVGICGLSTVQEEFMFSRIKVANITEKVTQQNLDTNSALFRNMKQMYEDVRSKQKRYDEGVYVLE